jgi:hypothetical protein
MQSPYCRVWELAMARISFADESVDRELTRGDERTISSRLSRLLRLRWHWRVSERSLDRKDPREKTEDETEASIRAGYLRNVRFAKVREEIERSASRIRSMTSIARR